jgi:hypothetical protein
MLQFLAETMGDGNGLWVSAATIGAIGLAVAGIVKAFKVGEAKGKTQDVNLKDPVPEVPIKRVYSPPTFYQHQELVRRVSLIEAEAKEHREHMDAQLRDIRREQAEQFVKLMNAGEVRKDAIMDHMNHDAGCPCSCGPIRRQAKIMINPLRRKQAAKAYLESLQMAGGYALEDSRLMSFVDDLIRPPLSFSEHGVVKQMLRDGKMIKAVTDALDPEMKMWVITDLGRNYLASL